MRNGATASPERLHHPTPISPPHRFKRVIPSEQEEDYATQQLGQMSSNSEVPVMTLAAVAAAATADLVFNQNYSTQQQAHQDGLNDPISSPTMTEMSHHSPGTRRLFIHPVANSQVAAPLPTAPLSSSEMSAAPSATSSVSSAGTLSTHNPPTPGSASPTKLDFAISSKSALSATGTSATYEDYEPRPAPLAPQPMTFHRRNEENQHQQQMYQNPPQTAPLPDRSFSFEEGNHPPASAHTNLHYAQCQTSAILAAAAEHHAQYEEIGSSTSTAPYQPQLPPLGAFSYSSAFPESPFHTKGSFSPLPTPEYTGFRHPLPPLRGFASHRPSATSPILDSAHQLISPLPTHMHVGLHGHPSPYGPGMLIPLPKPLNLDEEVKNIEAHSGATSFISKLWFLLSQPQEFGEYIRWTVKGKGFILSHNSPTFGEVILSRFFRHSNIASFIRQLNLYKMIRMSQLALLEDLNDSGGRVDGELTHTGFTHPHLQRGHPEMLHMIKPSQCIRKRTKKEMLASEALDEISPPQSPGRKTRTASTSAGSCTSR